MILACCYPQIKIKVEINVPNWEYCNYQADKNIRSDFTYSCMKGTGDNRDCIVFNKPLFSSNGWIKKCEECLKSEIIKSL